MRWLAAVAVVSMMVEWFIVQRFTFSLSASLDSGVVYVMSSPRFYLSRICWLCFMRSFVFDLTMFFAARIALARPRIIPPPGAANLSPPMAVSVMSPMVTFLSIMAFISGGLGLGSTVAGVGLFAFVLLALAAGRCIAAD